MSFTLKNRTRSLGFKSSASITAVRVTFSGIPTKQRRLQGDGLTDVVNGILITPISEKYPALAFVRWVDLTGAIAGEELTLDYADMRLHAPSSECVGFEIYVRSGSVFDVAVQTGGELTDLQNYYTKAEVTSLLSTYRAKTESPTYDEAFGLFATARDDAFYRSDVGDSAVKELQGFTFRQASEPAANLVSNGVTWREIGPSGNIVMDWERVGDKWKSLCFDTTKFGATAPFSATGIAYAALNRSVNAWLVFDEFQLFYNYTGGSTANYWNFQLGHAANGQAAINTLTAVLLLQKVNTTVWKTESGVITTQLPQEDLAVLRIVLTKVGTPGNIVFSGYVRYHWQRNST